MIEALLLIFTPGWTWDRIIRARRGVAFVLTIHLLPLVALSVAGELYGLLEWGRRVDYVHESSLVPHPVAVCYGTSQFLLSLVVVLVGARLIKALAETFHTRNTYSQCFTLVAYALSPLFLVRLFDAHPAMNPWITFSVGIILSVAALYQGIPRVLDPDPPHAFGLYLTSTVLLVFLCGLARIFTLLILEGKLKLA